MSEPTDETTGQPFTDARGLVYEPLPPEEVPLLPGEPGYEPPDAD